MFADEAMKPIMNCGYSADANRMNNRSTPTSYYNRCEICDCIHFVCISTVPIVHRLINNIIHSLWMTHLGYCTFMHNISIMYTLPICETSVRTLMTGKTDTPDNDRVWKGHTQSPLIQVLANPWTHVKEYSVNYKCLLWFHVPFLLCCFNNILLSHSY